jgi:hypothetical protein
LALVVVVTQLFREKEATATILFFPLFPQRVAVAGLGRAWETETAEVLVVVVQT